MSFLWKQCVDELSHDIEEENFNTWIRPIQAVENDAETDNKNGPALTLLAPNQFVLNKIKEHYLPQIRSILKNVAHHEVCLSFAIGSSAPSPSTTEKNAHTQSEMAASSQITPQQSQLNSNYTFENFIAGQSNQMAYSAALAVAQNPRTAYNPLFIRGNVGLGKTHLLHAIGNASIKHRHDTKVLYLHSIQFVTRVVNALRNGHEQVEAFRTQNRAVDVLLIDDVQMFANKPRCQEELFHLFNALIETGKQIIFACDTYPEEIKGVESRLISRFSSGLMQEIDLPELETKIAILKKKGEEYNISVPNDVAHFIASKLHTNIRALEGALHRVKASAEFRHVPIDLPLAQNALAGIIATNTRTLSIERIQSETAKFFCVRVSDLSCARRTRSLVRPRQVAMALCKELTNKSLPEIGAAFGGRDHTTVLHACRKIQKLKEEEESIRDGYIKLTRKLQQPETTE